jgi:acyl transferase domain-containing protein/NAD(P)H-dependent flavin oxidoreductase YrpB (nitropropane dioxygenase family)/NAD(P)-dependent dehydrogenase (short-subunit alcohol dehydrogenase family)
MIVLTLPGEPDASIAIAASRAGELGALDLEYIHDKQRAREVIEKLSRYTQNEFGVKLNSNNEEFLAEILTDLPDQLRVIILTGDNVPILTKQVQAFHDQKRTVLLEATSLSMAQFGEEVGADGIIAKGNEAGGRVGEETAFILFQRLLSEIPLPIFVHGGVGLHSTAALYTAGAAGVVLSSQLALTRESPLPEPTKTRLAYLDGSEMILLGDSLGEPYRVYSRPGLAVVEELKQIEQQLVVDQQPREETLAIWREAIEQRVGWGSLDENLLLLGQDAAFAAPLAQRFVTVAGVLEAMRIDIDPHIQAARSLRPLNEGAALAQSHGTRYPIVQGAMTRVSDCAQFALAVAEGGALPFLALALLRGAEVEALLAETHQRLAHRPWGVGILGFVPLELRQEQLAVVRAYRPPFALIAGGRPDQAKSLEEEGIATYLHIPSPGLLWNFLQDGAKRFVFEGRECGGHVGPRSSLVLWEQMIEVLLKFLDENPQSPSEYHVLFAGGIHDALSASMVSVMSSPLGERGVRVGVLMGTAYMFTEEAVTSGAIIPKFQRQALECQETVLLETGLGHSTRCINTAYVDTFRREKLRLAREGRSLDEIRNALELLNIGRLRIASKGITRASEHMEESGASASRFATLSEAEQDAEGMYMIGQVAGLRRQTSTITELHQDVSLESTRMVEEVELFREPSPLVEESQRPSDVAIIGMACLLPKGPDLETYWENILNKVDAITEVPKDRWDWELYYDPDRQARDKVYSKWGGFLDDVSFDPVRYGMPPSSLPSIEPLQALTLEVVRAALQDAGYLERPFPRERTSVIIGTGGGGADQGMAYGFRSLLPHYLGRTADLPFDPAGIIPHVEKVLPEWTEDSFAGILANVVAGRVANRFDLGGRNYTVDAACAASLAALDLAVNELENRTSDMVIVGGADTMQGPFAYLCFSKTQALSPRGRCYTFDESADGIVIGEGVAILILKRLADAERDGDRVYAVVKGVGGSSDGRDLGLTAPRPSGQVRALKRAYAKAGVSPATVELVEAHGTGTVSGDQAEIEALTTVFTGVGAELQSCAIGSVKSMIGHTKSAAGIASVIKVALALRHKILPPTLNVKKPNPKANFQSIPFYVNTEPRPWVGKGDNAPRRAGVSSFGFGGTNFHAVLEEYTGDYLDCPSGLVPGQWPSELFIWEGDSREELLQTIESFEKASLQWVKDPPLGDLAYTLHRLRERDGAVGLRLAVVATSVGDLRQKLARAKHTLAQKEVSYITDPTGIYFTEQPLAPNGKVAFLFPGQGSQYPNMFQDLCIHFPEIRAGFERANQILKGALPRPLSTYVYPHPVFSEEEEQSIRQALTDTQIAQPSLGVVGIALFKLLRSLGIEPDFAGGHSYGEYIALCAAGVFEEDALVLLSEARGRFILAAAKKEPSTMTAVEAGAEVVSEAIAGVKGVVLANKNAPRQTIISGTLTGVEEASSRLIAQGIQVRRIPVACAFHSPVVAGACEPLANMLREIELGPPRFAVYSNTSAKPYPQEPPAIINQLAEHLAAPVEFVREIEAMYEAGARVFVEVGPGTVLTGLTGQILGEKTHLAVAMDQPGRLNLIQLHHSLAQLAVHGISVRLDRLYEGRKAKNLDLNNLPTESQGEDLSLTAWMVNGARARPARELSVTRSIPEPQKTSKALPSEAAGRLESPASFSQRPSNGKPEERIGNLRAKPEEKERPAVVSSSLEPPLPAQRVAETHSASPATEVRLPAGPPSMPVLQNGSNEVMIRFQEMMNRFLDTQKNVMLTYLRKSTNGKIPDIPQPSNGIGPHSEVPKQEFFVQTHPDEPSPEEQPAEIVPDIPIAPEGDTPSGAEQVASDLLTLVSERTGYPLEILGLDMDLEADLGIDSIKRIEILGSLQKLYPLGKDRGAGEEVEELVKIKTLRGIIDWIASHSNPHPRATEAPEPNTEAAHAETVQRFTLAAVEQPLNGSPIDNISISLAEGRIFVLIDDGVGVADVLAFKLLQQGLSVALVKNGPKAEEVSDGHFTADLTSPESVAELCDLLRQKRGAIGGLAYLLPLQHATAFEEMDYQSWSTSLDADVKSLFYLAKALGADLQEAAKAGGAYVLAATSMGGTFASADEAQDQSFSPGQGGTAGLLKALAREWTGIHTKVVDLDLQESASRLADYLLTELATRDSEVEVGYQSPRRIVLQPVESPLQVNGPAAAALDSSSVVLVTGGARGITAAVVHELAERYRPILLLVGRTPLLSPQESEEIIGLNSPQDVKAAIIKQMRLRGEMVIPNQVEAASSRILKDREIRENLQVLRSTGAQVEYFAVDVRDEPAFGSLIDDIYQRYGRIDGVIHGAGVIEDRLVEDKTPSSFDLVFDTKVNGAFLLSRKLRINELSFLVFFSSLSGRFGNRGQCDYSAANEVLNKLAVYLNRRYEARVVSVNWGPWQSGMVSPELQKHFAQQGITLIPMSLGPKEMDRELLHGRKNEVEVLIGGAQWSPRPKGVPASEIQALPLLNNGNNGAFSVKKAGLPSEIVYGLDLDRDLYLHHHRLDSKPVLPMAVALELMAEAVTSNQPDLQVVEVTDLRVLQGIILEDSTKEIRVVGQPRSLSPGEDLELAVSVFGARSQEWPNYRAAMKLARTPPTPPLSREFLPAINGAGLPISIEDVYRHWLFHGPLLQGIAEVHEIGPDGVSASLLTSSPNQWLAGSPGSSWLIDPGVIDGGLQLILLWARMHWDMTPLPSGFRSYRRFGTFSSPKIHCQMSIRPESGRNIIHADLAFWGTDGRVLGFLEDLEASASKALNRLAENNAL